MRHTIPWTTIQLGVAMAVVAILGVAAAAWACTPKPQNFALDPPVAAADQPAVEVTATGQLAADRDGTIHWTGGDGPVLAQATPQQHTGQFTATFQVPDSAEPGVAYVVAAAGDDASQGVTRAALELTGSGDPAATSSWQAGDQPTVTDTETGPAGLSTPAMAGMGMLALGGAALFASFTTVAVQRRRVPTHRMG
jgi:hypothetical protein